jgi:hypothetical protein
MNFLSDSVYLLGGLSKDATVEAKCKPKIFKYIPHKTLHEDDHLSTYRKLTFRIIRKMK